MFNVVEFGPRMTGSSTAGRRCRQLYMTVPKLAATQSYTRWQFSFRGPAIEKPSDPAV